ncbi:MAG: hypothetical protein J6Y29_04005 [Clostridiales bacterium]|nr:hypothetical protein [Clostridiales bacterium]
MTHNFEQVIVVFRWIVNVPLLILCIDELKKAFRELQINKYIRSRILSKINFIVGLILLVAYIPNLFFREISSCLLIVASWICFYTVSNKFSIDIEKYVKVNYINLL